MNNVTSQRLQQALKSQNITAAELSRRSGIGKSAICRYLKGTIVPKPYAINRLAEALHADPVWLLGYDTVTSSDDLSTIEGLETKLKDYMISRFGSVNRFSTVCGIPYSTIATILDRGIDKATFSNMVKICQTLNISVDALIKGDISTFDDITYGVALSALTAINSAKLIAYYQGLLDAQED